MKFFYYKKKYLILPKISIKYFLLFIIILICIAFILDFIILKPLKKESILSSTQQWKKENEVININNLYKRGFTHTQDSSNCFELGKALSINKITKINLCINKKYKHKLFRNKTFINDFIFRSKVYHVNTKTTHKRILVVGDSYVWGDGYANMNDIWWRKLQRELIKRGYYDVEVISAGWRGMNTREELILLKNVLKVYNPDIIVWGYVINDPDENIIKCIDSEYATAKKNYDFILQFLSFLKNIFPNLAKQSLKARVENISKTANKSYNSKILYDYHDWELAILEGENFEKYKKTAKDVGVFINNNKNIPIFFVTLPERPAYKFYNARYQKILSLFAFNHIKMYNLLTNFADEGFSYPLWSPIWQINPANGHPGVIATDFYARQVANILEKNYPNTLPKKYAGNKPNEPFINDWVPMTFDIKQNGNILNFEYPSDTQNFLSMPYGYKYIQLNLSYPKKVKKILLNGSDLKSARLDIIYENPKDQTVYQLGFKKGQKLTWQNFKSKELVNSIRINADFSSNKNKFITLKIITEENN